MKYYSLHAKSPRVGFKQAVINGIAPDRGLYFPEHIPSLPPSFFKTIEDRSEHDLAMEALLPFVGSDISEGELQSILREVLDFEFPLIPLGENMASLELFHGPTMAFKDVGARFMARCLGYFTSGEKQEITVLVATSGDTGGAVANGFLGVEGVRVVILYPEGKVSDIQERQLTTLGQNIRALKVAGTFDDCQHMVKTAFLDEGLTKILTLTSANSINVARWLPQMLYYLYAYRQLKDKTKAPVFSVPSGNFGNICAGMVAHRMGLPVKHFIAATNSNDTVPHFMSTGNYQPKPSTATISNAMDVGDPSNFTRIRHLYGDIFDSLSTELSSYSFTDQQTRAAMAEIYRDFDYVADPHGAVGYLGLKKFLQSHPGNPGIFLETAHPVKFKEIVEQTLGKDLDLPPQIRLLMDREKKSESISNYQQLRDFLAGSADRS